MSLIISQLIYLLNLALLVLHPRLYLSPAVTQGLRPVLGGAGSGGGGLDRQHRRGEELLSTPAEDRLHHR